MNILLSIKKLFLSRGLFFYQLTFGLVIIYIIFHMFDYSQASMQPEAVHFSSIRGPDSGFIHNSLINGTKLVPEDFLLCFDVLSFESKAPRVRFFSNLVMLVNFKLRVWLWNYIPPHPSFSLTWIFSFFSLVLLYKLIYNLTLDRAAAWIGLSLYGISLGYLSGIILLFHPAKPLTNFFTILCFYLASRIIIYAEKNEYFSKRVFVWLLVFMFLGFFTDETAWFIFVLIPIVFPGIFNIKGKSKYIIISYYCIGVAFGIILLYVTPYFIRWFGFKNFDFLSYIRKGDGSGGPFEFTNIFLQGYYFTSEYISPFKTSSFYNYYIFFLFFIYSIYSFTKLSPEKRRLFYRILITLFIFLTLQTILLTKHLVIVHTSWYYGSLFPIFFTLLLTVILSVKKGSLRIINKVIFILIICVTAFNTHHNIRSANLGLTFPLVLKAWKQRGNKSALAKSHYVSWLVKELEYSGKPGIN